MPKKLISVFLFSPHFAEYSLRLSGAENNYIDVFLVLSSTNFDAEVDHTIPTPGRTRFLLMKRATFWQKLLAIPIVCFAAIKFRPDVIHLHDSGTLVDYLIARFLIFFWPTIITVHDPRPHSGEDAVSAKAIASRTRLLRQKSRAFHVHGQYCANALCEVEDVAGRPICITAHGPILVPTEIEKKNSILMRVLLFGRMQSYKGVEDFIDLIVTLGVRFPTLVGVLAGKGPEIERLTNKLQLSKNIELINRFLAPAELRQQLQLASIIVAPYLDATQSGIVSAAFANGRPVLATSVGGLVDSVDDGKNGILVPPSDSKKLGDALSNFLLDRKLQVQVTEGALNTSVQQSWASISLKLTDIYRTIALNQPRN